MFKIFVTIYLLMHGQPVGDPMKMTNRISYETLEDCIAGKDSEPVQDSLNRLRAGIEAGKPEGGSFTLGVSCEKHDDGSI